jgi:hypothetical protein
MTMALKALVREPPTEGGGDAPRAIRPRSPEILTTV